MGWYFGDHTEFSSMLGQTLVDVTGATAGSEEIIFTLSDGRRLYLWHEQSCCEMVSVEDVVGDVADLIGTPLTMAEETSNSTDPNKYPENDDWGYSYTWTFYRLATVKGYVTIRWYGSSNGYYSESVSFAEREEQ